MIALLTDLIYDRRCELLVPAEWRHVSTHTRNRPASRLRLVPNWLSWPAFKSCFALIWAVFSPALPKTFERGHNYSRFHTLKTMSKPFGSMDLCWPTVRAVFAGQWWPQTGCKYTSNPLLPVIFSLLWLACLCFQDRLPAQLSGIPSSEHRSGFSLFFLWFAIEKCRNCPFFRAFEQGAHFLHFVSKFPLIYTSKLSFV